MTNILPYQLPLRQRLPQIVGNHDYRVFRETLQRMAEIIRLSDMDEVVVRYCLEQAEEQARKQAKQRGKRFRSLSGRQQRWVQRSAREALRCGVARSLVGRLVPGVQLPLGR